MFNKSIRKIVLMVMVSLIVFIAFVIAIIYLTSYGQVKRENFERLQRYSMNYNYEMGEFGPGGDFGEPTEEVPAIPGEGETPPEEGQGDMPPEGMPPFDGRPDDFQKRRIDTVNIFYSVLLTSDLEVVKTDLGINGIYKENEIVSISKDILNKNKTQGNIDSLSYLVTNHDDYILVAFIDNTIVNDSFNTLLIWALIVSGVSLAIAFVVSIFIAKRIVKPLEENDKLQRQFISDAGHELKTPVSIINANAELLSREIKDNEWLNNIQYENERMRLLITELLDLSRVENKKVEFEKIDYSHLVTGEVLPFETLAFEKGLTINSNIEEGINVLGNQNQLKQLTSILLDNAIKYTDGGNEINVSLKSDHKTIVLTVENYCKDVPIEKQQHLFDRFYRADEARTNNGNHYGLGLAIAKAIVDKHNGKIAATFNNGKAIFTVKLGIL